MSKYTTTIRDILDSYLTDAERYSDLSVLDIINKTKDKFFNFEFEWYSDGDGLEEFKRDFLFRYYNNYIGFETLGMFKTSFTARLNIDMSKYKALYSQISKEYDPLKNHDMHYDHKHESDESGTNSYTDTGKSTTDTSSDYQSIDSDNPQVTFSHNDYASGMTRGQNKGKNETSGNNSHDGKDSKHIEGGENNHDWGLTGKSSVDAIAEFREKFINLNKEIIESCRPLFLQVW